MISTNFYLAHGIAVHGSTKVFYQFRLYRSHFSFRFSYVRDQWTRPFFAVSLRLFPFIEFLNFDSLAQLLSDYSVYYYLYPDYKQYPTFEAFLKSHLLDFVEI